jgi:hypothetical protein
MGVNVKNFRYWLKGLLYWVVVPIFSGPLKGCRFGLFTGSRFITGKYGGAEVNHVLELAKPGQVVFDIGAHVGYFRVCSFSCGNQVALSGMSPRQGMPGSSCQGWLERPTSL